MGTRDIENKEICYEFDSDRRILHLGADPPLHLVSIDQLHSFKRDNLTLLQRYCSNDRIYLVVDIGHIVIEPSLLQEYQRMAKEFFSEYLYPDGVARYGFEITRVTVTMAYQDDPSTGANIFATREQAYQFIDKQIEQRIARSDLKKSAY